MKNKINSFLIAIAALCAVAVQPAFANPIGYIDVPLGTNVLSVINQTNSTTSTTSFYLPASGSYQSSGMFKIPQNCQLTLQPNFTGSGNTTSNVVFSFNFSTDNTSSNLSTTTPLTYLIAASSANNVVGYAVVNWTNTTGAAYGQLTAVGTASTNTVTINSFRIGYKNISTAGY